MSITRMVRMALASRRLFRNWLWAGIMYMLYKHGVLHTDKVGVVCRDGSRDAIPINIYGDLLSGYFNGVVVDYLCRNRTVKFSSGFELPINGLSGDMHATLSAVRLGWSYDVDHGYWFKGNVKFKHMFWSVLQVFEFGEYKDVEVAGKVVVDVGAYVGDSAIYFAMRGAERVIAVEPHPGAFGEMLENIRLNNLEGKVIPINAGLASERGRVCLRDVSTASTWYVYHEPGNCEDGVEALTLNEILSRYMDNALSDIQLLLKMDCEGCEYDVIINDYGSVRRFNEVIFEYHAHAVKRTVRELLNVLDKDFECHSIRGNDEIGIIKCIRRS